MPAAFIDFLRASASLSDAALRRIAALVRTRDFPRGAAFATVGAVTDEIGFVEKGLFKLHGEDADGKPFVVEFVGEGEVVSDYAAMVRGLPASLTITALENSVLSSLPFGAYLELLRTEPGIQDLARKLLEDLVVKLSQRELQFLTMTAKQRFLGFQADRAALFARVPRQDIAAYLGITPVSLSRLAGQIQRERRDGAVR